MIDQAAQSISQIRPEDVRYVVQSDHDKRPDRMSTSQPVRSLFHAFQAARRALNNGATEVRIRPYP